MKGQIEDARTAYEGSVFGYYVRDIAPEITRMAKHEGEGHALFNFENDFKPVTAFTHHFVQALSIYSLE